MSRSTLDSAHGLSVFVYGTFTLYSLTSQTVPLTNCLAFLRSLTPECTHPGLGSSNFARRYFRNRCFFLFLRLLRCFSSPGSPPHVMDWRADACGFRMRVSPFRHLRITGYVPLPAAFRSLSRLSSAPGARASALCSFLLDLFFPFRP